jgi:hypothetical protein
MNTLQLIVLIRRRSLARHTQHIPGFWREPRSEALGVDEGLRFT